MFLLFFSSFFHITTSPAYSSLSSDLLLLGVSRTPFSISSSHTWTMTTAPSTDSDTLFPSIYFFLPDTCSRDSPSLIYYVHSHRLLFLLAEFAQQLNKTFLFSPQSLYMLSCTFGKLPFSPLCSLFQTYLLHSSRLDHHLTYKLTCILLIVLLGLYFANNLFFLHLMCKLIENRDFSLKKKKKTKTFLFFFLYIIHGGHNWLY